MAWLTGWDYRKSHVINAATGAGTNYQKRIKVHYGSGTDSGEDVYTGSHCKTDFGDVRFTDNDGTTLLDYWMEEKVDSDYAVFWVEVKDDLSSSNQTIYIYYGKSDATTTSNGEATFPFFDDFDTDTSGEYTIDDGSFTWETAYSRLKSSRISTGQCILHHSTFTGETGYAFRIKERGSALDDYAKAPSVLFAFQDASNFYIYRQQWDTDVASGDYIQFYKRIAGTFTKLANTGEQPTVEYHILEAAWIDASHVKCFYDGELVLDITSGLESWTSGKIGLRDYLEPQANGYWDYLIVRKYVDPEPSHGAWGSEETVGVYPTRSLRGRGGDARRRIGFFRSLRLGLFTPSGGGSGGGSAPVTETKSPTGESGDWHDPTNAYNDDLNYAYCGSGEGGLTHDYSDYGFDSSGTINEVRVDVKGYSGDGTKHTVKVYVWDGSAWQLVGTITSETECDTHQFDAIAYIDTPEKLNGIKTRIESTGLAAGGPTERYVRVCWIPIYAKYTPP